MPLCIVYTRPEDGGLSVVYPAFGYDMETVAKRAVPAGATWRIIDSSELPTDRSPEARHAWKDDGKKITIDDTRRAQFRQSRKKTPEEEIALLKDQVQNLLARLDKVAPK